MITVTLRVHEDLWRSLRRLAEQERDTQGRAAVGPVAVKLLRQALEHRATADPGDGQMAR